MKGSTHNPTAVFTPDDQSVWAEWRKTGLILCLAGLGVVGLFWETVQSMIHIWASSRTFAHGFFILPATAYLIWCYRSLWLRLVPTPSLGGMTALVLLGAGWLVGYVKDVVWIQQAAVVAMLPGLVWTIVGVEIVKSLLWPLGFLVFMLPMGTSIEPWLQDFTAWFIQVGLDLANIPYLYENYQIIITTGVWQVAKECAGLRYFQAGLALGSAFAMLIYRQSARRFIFLVICTVALMVANGLRAYGVIVGDHLGIADGTDHRVFGYAIFGVTITLLFWLGLRWRENVTSLEHRTIGVRDSIDTRKIVLMAIAAVAVLAVAPLSVFLWFNRL